MKDRKGFTLVELLGVIVILAIVIGIAVTALIGINGKVDVTYYKEVEQSAKFAGGEYYAYSKDNLPSIFGDQKKVTLKYLKDNGFIDDDIKDKQGDSCDLEESYVGAYKDSIDRTNYFVCLKCGEYSTNTKECSGEVDYTLGITAKKKTSGEIVDKKGKEWLNDSVVLTFETLNDMDDVYVEFPDGTTKSCHLDTRNGIKTCTIEVSQSGDYTSYAKGKDKETRKEELTFKIDKTGPDFNVKDKTNGKILESIVDVDVNDTNVSAFKKQIELLVDNIKDNESGIKNIEYTFEKEGERDKYQKQAIAPSFDIKKELEVGTYKLKVRVENNAGIKKEEEITFRVYRKVADPTSAYCYDLTYNGSTQTLVREAGEGYVFSSTRGSSAGNYNITAKLKEGYRFANNGTSNVTFSCTIKKKDATVTAKGQTIEYDGDIIKELSQASVDGLIGGHKLSGITLNKNVVGGGKNTIIASNAIIYNENDVDVSSNYNISYKTGVLIVNPKVNFKIVGDHPDGVNDNNGYKNGSKVEVTCESVDGITSFVLSGGTSGNGTLSGGVKQTGTLTLDSNGKNIQVKGVCKTETGGVKEATSNYNIYVYNANESACGCQTRNSCRNSDCSCATWDRCSSAGCASYTYGSWSSADCTSSNSKSGYEANCHAANGGCSNPNHKYICMFRKKTCSQYNRSSSCGCETRNSCVSDKCSCKTANSCWHL